MIRIIRFPVYRGLGFDIPFLKGSKTIGWIATTGLCRIDLGDKEFWLDGEKLFGLDIEDDDVEVINLSGEHVFVEVKYYLHDDDRYNTYKNNVLEGVSGFQFLDEDGNWYNYPY